MNLDKPQNRRVGDKYKIVSVAVSHDEKELFKTIAKAANLKTGTALRLLIFRGLEGYLNDGKIAGEEFDVTIVGRLRKLVKTDPKLRRASALVRESADKPPTVAESEIHVFDPADTSQPPAAEAEAEADDTDTSSKGRETRSA
jgi:hypothetical protein